MPARISYAVGLALLLGSASARGDDQQLVDQYLQDLGARGYVINPVGDDYVARTFAGFSFFGVQFREYPVPIYPPEGTDLEESNLFIVQNGVVTFLVDTDALATFFANQLGPVPDPEAALDAGRSWLRLSEELKQDLFFIFSAPDVQYETSEDGALVSGQVLVVNGGTGAIAVSMSFD